MSMFLFILTFLTCIKREKTLLEHLISFWFKWLDILDNLAMLRSRCKIEEFIAAEYLLTSFSPVLFSPLQQDEESPGHSPPSSPPAFPDDDPETGGQFFRRRAHTFSHPPVKKRISFDGQPAGQSKALLHRQQSVNQELLQSR